PARGGARPACRRAHDQSYQLTKPSRCTIPRAQRLRTFPMAIGGRAKAPAAGGEILIVGPGPAGPVTALQPAAAPATLASPAPLGEGASSAWAQGGIAAAVGEGDTPELHAADTIKAGAGTVDERIAHLVAAEAGDRVRDLLAYGVPFDKDLEGRLIL